ncbi:MAG TPA: phosphate ABC transporter substrate-binding protein PstS [Terracidiphilus sp.]|nr:phosphate ABC transporter substrate-binding protein PstS [Terracidiphilus sp.]
MSRSTASRTYGAACVAAIAAVLAAAQSAPLTISESGSTLIYPLFQSWVGAYAKVDPGVRLSDAATGSGAGISQAIAARVQIGTSDAYMSDNQAMAHEDILNIPLVISAQTVDVNIPELRGGTLKLSGPVLAGIYSGKIRMWDDGQIAALNRGVRLPHSTIIPVRRAEGSGDTFIFTQFLTFSDDTGPDPDANPNSWGNKIGYGTTVSWPSVSEELTATGNAGMVQAIAHTPYTMGYVGASFEAVAAKAGLITAMLENQDGKFLLPNAATISAAAATLTPRTPPDERLTLVFAPGPDSYPLINYEYAIVSDRQPNQQEATAISNFLLWCISPQGGSASGFLDPVHFIALPTSIRARSEIQIAKIQ